MFQNFFRPTRLIRSRSTRPSPALEHLEPRSLLSIAHAPLGYRGGSAFGSGSSSNSITFSQAPAAVQTGLASLASTDGLSAPTSTSTVLLGNSNGLLTYTIKVTATGATTLLTVDSSGAAVTAPTQFTTTFGALANPAVSNEFTAIATALGLTAPTSSTTVNVSTTSGGAATYSIALSPASSSGKYSRAAIISVDSAGNPVGNASLPLSVFSTTIQNALTSNAPTGAAALTSTSLVSVRTLNGLTTYSATYTTSGARTIVSVNSAGALTSLPSTSTSTFGAIPAAAQTTLQNLATARGISTAIPSTQSVLVFTESGSLTIYTVRLAATGTTSSGATYTYYISLSSDQNGNPTVLPQGAGNARLCV